METFRLNFLDLDNSLVNNNLFDTTISGFMAIRAPKGEQTAMYFPRGSTQLIERMIGAPTEAYPGIQEAIEYNNNYGLWISAPAGNTNSIPSYYGGVYLTSHGLLDFLEVTDKRNPNYISKVAVRSEGTYLGSINTSALTFVDATPTPITPSTDPVTASYPLTITIPDVPNAFFTDTTVKKLRLTRPDGKKFDLTFNTSTGDVEYVSGVTTTVVGAYTTTSSTEITLIGNASLADFNLTANGASAQYFITNFTDIDFDWIVDVTDSTYMTFAQKSPTEKETVLTISKIGYWDDPTTSNRNKVDFSVSENVYPNSSALVSGGSFKTSMDTAGVNDSGASIFAETVLPDDAASFIEITVVKKIEATDTIVKKVTGLPVTKTLKGVRAAVSNISDSDLLVPAWSQEATKTKYANVSVFMDYTRDPLVIAQVATVAETYNKLGTYVTGIKSALGGVDDANYDSSLVTADLIATRNTLPKVKVSGAYYANELEKRATYTNKKYWVCPVGAIGIMLSRIIERRLGGIAPMYSNENEMGGQISTTFLRHKYEFSAADQKLLDDAGINPIINDSFYGLMLIGQKTMQNPSIDNDYAYLGHTMAFNLFRKEMKESVMIPQIGKLNDTFHQDLRKRQSDEILNRRIAGNLKIWDTGSVLVREVNTEAVKAAKDFRIRVTVRVTPFSNTVTLEFTNENQIGTVV